MITKLFFVWLSVTDNIKYIIMTNICQKEIVKKGFLKPLGAYPGLTRKNYVVPLLFINIPGPEQKKHIK